MSFTGIAAFLLAAAALFGQSPNPEASVQGVVRDSQGKAVAGATVQLQVKSTGRTLAAETDAHGVYRVAALSPGTYSLRVTAAGAGEAAEGPFVLGTGERKSFDLTLQYAFFDEPNFIVAGVTDTASRGGHGSDTVMRSSESLAQATAVLGHGAESPAAGEASLREAIAKDPANAPLHHALADSEEKQGNALEAVREYQLAAELESSEANLFDWGAELLKHRANEPATEVFIKGNRLFPRSARMILGLAAAWYARGSYDQAASRFFEACDLDPADPQPYMFLGKVESLEITQLPGYAERLKRFAERYPDNAWANYYFAVSLWKQRIAPEDTGTPARVRELLERAIRLDAGLGLAYLQLGVVYSSQGDSLHAIAAYRKSIDASPQLDEPHYRLGQTLARTGDQETARKELEVYQQMSKRSAEEAQRERDAMQQFVYELRQRKSAH